MRRTRLSYAALTLLLLAGCGRRAEDGGEALRQAAQRGNVAEVKSLIARGADLDARDSTGKTALFNALGNREVVELLLTHGADINAQDRWGFTPLHAALRSRAVDVARLLINRGAHIQTRSHDNETPLHAAAEIDDVEIVRLLVRRGADVNGATSIGDTPLLRAARRGYLDIAQSLIAEGADVNIRAAEEPATPLHAAIEIGHKRLVQFLLDSGAAVDASDLAGRSPATRAMQKNFKDIVTILAKAGATIDLHLAAYLGDVETARRLLDSGTDVDLRDSRSWTPLHYAAQQGQSEVTELLISNGANVDVTDEYGNTPLQMAIRHLEVTKLLVNHGADLDAENQFEQTALQRAISRGDKKVLDFLVDRGARIDLHMAAYIGRLDKVKELVTSGADVNLGHNRLDETIFKELSRVYPKATTTQGKPRADTPLHRAVQGGHADVVEFLVSVGADLEAQDVKGRTALHEAAYLGFAEIAKTLMAHGANVNAVVGSSRQYGETPLQMAAHGGHAAIVALLVVHGADANAKDSENRSALFHAWTKGFSDVVTALGSDVNDLALSDRQPYKVIIRNPEAIQKVLLPDECDATWAPTQAEIEGLDLVLRSFLVEHTAIATNTWMNREALLANLRRYNQEYGGFIRNGIKHIVCNLVMTEDPEIPNEEEFTWWSTGCEDIARIIFDAERRTVIRIDDPTFYVCY